MFINMPDCARLISREMSDQFGKMNKIGKPSRAELKRWSYVINAIQDEFTLNFISEKIAKKDLKQKHTQAILYYVRESTVSQAESTENPQVEMHAANPKN
jgi:hypothetical protein